MYSYIRLYVYTSIHSTTRRKEFLYWSSIQQKLRNLDPLSTILLQENNDDVGGELRVLKRAAKRNFMSCSSINHTLCRLISSIISIVARSSYSRYRRRYITLSHYSRPFSSIEVGLYESRTKSPWTKSPRTKTPPTKTPPDKNPSSFRYDKIH